MPKPTRSSATETQMVPKPGGSGLRSRPRRGVVALLGIPASTRAPRGAVKSERPPRQGCKWDVVSARQGIDPAAAKRGTDTHHRGYSNHDDAAVPRADPAGR